eukprot:gene22015-biopygen4183
MARAWRGLQAIFVLGWRERGAGVARTCPIPTAEARGAATVPARASAALGEGAAAAPLGARGSVPSPLAQADAPENLNWQSAHGPGTRGEAGGAVQGACAARAAAAEGSHCSLMAIKVEQQLLIGLSHAVQGGLYWMGGWYSVR